MKEIFSFVAAWLVAVSFVPVVLAQVVPPGQLRLVLDTNIFQLPEDRSVPWEPGIRGGIPNYPVSINVKNAPYNAKGDGVTDDYAAINQAIQDCTSGRAVYIPSGKYKLSKQLLLNKSIVLRGDGYGNTRLVCYDTSSSDKAAIYILGPGGGPSSSVTSGATKGSTELTLSSASGFTVGGYITLQQQNDLQVIIGTIPSGNANFQGQILQITNVSGNRISVSRPLYYTYNPSMNPFVKQSVLLTNCGIENLSVEMRGNLRANIVLDIAANCWIKQVESTNSYSPAAHISLGRTYRCEVRGSLIHFSSGQYKSVYGIQLSDLATDNLIEDNSIDAVSTGVVLQNGACGNVVGYNYMWRGFGTDYPNDTCLKYSYFCHGGNPNMNLFEGNVGSQIACDNFWGCNRANTFFRNWATAFSLNGSGNPTPDCRVSVEIDADNRNNNFVANVFCRPEDSQHTGSSLVWDIGWNHNNNVSSPPYSYDANVVATTIRHGNFDYVSGSTQWDSSFSKRVFPPSLYLKSKPAFFGSAAWPPFGVASDGVPPAVGTLPAQNRF